MESDRLLIRPFTPDDWQDLYEYLAQEAGGKYEPYSVFTEDVCKQETFRRLEDNSFSAVYLKNSAKVIGNIYLAKQEFDTWELGYVFNADYHGK